MKEHVFLLAYINSKGDTKRKTLTSWDEVDNWVSTLDKRIERGTCGGYIISIID